MPDTDRRRRPYVLGVILVVAMYAAFGVYDVYRHERSEADRGLTRDRLGVDETSIRRSDRDLAALRAEVNQIRDRVARLESAR